MNVISFDGIINCVLADTVTLIFRSQKILAPKRADLSGTHTVAATFNPRNAEHPERPHLLTVAETVLCWEHMQPYIAEFSKLHPEDNM